MANAPLVRMALGSVPCDVEHGLARGTSVTAPGGATFTTAKEAPLGGEVYLLKHASGVAVTLPSALSALGYTAPDYELVSGRNLVVAGKHQWPNTLSDWSDGSRPYWFYLDTNGDLCRVQATSTTVQIKPIGPFRTDTPSTYSYGASMPAMTTLLDAADNGSKVLLASHYGSGDTIFDTVELYQIWELTLSGPADSLTVTTTLLTTYPATNSSSQSRGWVMYDRNPTTGDIDTTTSTNTSTPTGHQVVAQTSASDAGYQNNRLIGARYTAGGVAEIVYVDVSWSGSFTGSWTPTVIDHPEVHGKLGCTGSYSQTFSLTFALRAGATVIETATYDYSATGELGEPISTWAESYSWGGSSGHVANSTRSPSGSLSTWTYYAIVGGVVSTFYAPSYGSPMLGGYNGYQFMQLPSDKSIYATYVPIYLMTGMRLTNKCYAIAHTYYQGHTVTGVGYLIWICRVRVNRVVGINGADKVGAGATPIVDWVSSDEEDYTIPPHMVAATQHPLTYDLAAEEASSYNWSLAYI